MAGVLLQAGQVKLREGSSKLIPTFMVSFACLLAVGVSYNNICSIDLDSGALLFEKRFRSSLSSFQLTPC